MVVFRRSGRYKAIFCEGQRKIREQAECNIAVAAANDTTCSSNGN